MKSKDKMLNFILNFVLLRIKQGYRILTEQGIYAIPILLLSCLLLAFCYKMLTGLANLWVQIIIATLFCTIDQKRNDQKFIQYLKENGKYVVFVEYLILLILIEIPFAINKQINYFALIPLVTILLLILSKTSTLVRGVNKVSFVNSVTYFISINAFEWRAGIRKHSFFFILSYTIGFVLLFFYPITPILMLYWLTFSGEFYNTLENKEIIQCYQTIKNFKIKKIRSFFVSINFIYLPHYITFLWLYANTGLITLLVGIVIFNLIFLFSLLYKYQKIENKKHIKNTLPITFFSVVALFLPISLYKIIILWKNIKINLKPYLK
mgnify:CR=1 FL=1